LVNDGGVKLIYAGWATTTRWFGANGSCIKGELRPPCLVVSPTGPEAGDIYVTNNGSGNVSVIEP